MPREQYKYPGIATALSFLWMGLGQLYNGQIPKGIAFCIIYAIAISLSLSYSVNRPLAILASIGGTVLWVVGMVDANREAKRINAELSNPPNP